MYTLEVRQEIFTSYMQELIMDSTRIWLGYLTIKCIFDYWV